MIDHAMRATVHRLAAARARLLEERPLSDGGFECFTEEAAVLGALGVEIGFKALIFDAKGLDYFSEARSVFPKGSAKQLHNLKFLFGLLRNEHRAAIFQHFEARGAQRWEYYVKAADEAAATQVASWISKTRNFDEMLDLSAESFEQFRYSYEKDNIATPTTFLRIMLDAVIELLGPEQPADEPHDSERRQVEGP